MLPFICLAPMTRYNYGKLLTWQFACDLLNEINTIVNQQFIDDDYRLADQIRRSAMMVPAYIIEGNKRYSGTGTDEVHAFYNAAGLAAQLIVQLDVAHQLHYIDESTYDRFHHGYLRILDMLGHLVTNTLKELEQET